MAIYDGWRVEFKRVSQMSFVRDERKRLEAVLTQRGHAFGLEWIKTWLAKPNKAHLQSEDMIHSCDVCGSKPPYIWHTNIETDEGSLDFDLCDKCVLKMAAKIKEVS